jgi:hypothetical protein
MGRTVMSESEARVSGDLARLNELVRYVVEYGSAIKLLAEHKPDEKGRCSACRSIGCTLYTAALAAKQLGGSHRDR